MEELIKKEERETNMRRLLDLRRYDTAMTKEQDSKAREAWRKARHHRKFQSDLKTTDQVNTLKVAGGSDHDRVCMSMCG